MMLALSGILLAGPGCRQAPKNPPKYYAAEVVEMEKQARREQQAKNEKFLDDRYPWEGKVKPLQSLPCRIGEKEKSLNSQIDYLHTFIHGKKRCKRQLRD